MRRGIARGAVDEVLRFAARPQAGGLASTAVSMILLSFSFEAPSLATQP